MNLKKQLIRFILKLNFIAIFGFCGISSVFAQNVDEISDEQIQQFMKQAQESGMTEEQLMAAAAAKGFGSADIAKFKERMMRLQADKKGVGNVNTTNTERKLNDTLNFQKLKSTTIKEDSSVIRREKYFGLNLFTNKKIVFEPNLRIPTPKNYILGTDDELNISITGFAVQNYKAKVSPEGTIQIDILSPIYVSGLTIEQARERIISRLKSRFAGLNSTGGGLYADVTLGNIRSISVTVIGEAVQPGTFTVPSLANVFNVLYACGGPSEIGSMRNIEVFRNGKLIRTLDVYDFLLRGDQKDNIILQDQDIIHIPYVGGQVSLLGEIRNPKIFEIKQGETLKDIFAFAGGFKELAYTKSISLERVTPTEKRIITIVQNEIASFIPQKGDIYTVGKVLNRLENVVTIKGAVYREGNYELEKGMTLKQLINIAEGLKEDAFKERVLLKRERENLEPEIINVNLSEILLGKKEDISLKLRDTVFIKSYKDLRERLTVSISGAVNKAGVYEFVDNMTVSDLIMIAGGFSDGASASKIEIARRIKGDTTGVSKEQSIKIETIDIDRNLIGKESKKLMLKPFDRIYVRTLPRYEEQKNVSIVGEVFYPGPYALRDKTEKISDLIYKAGGMKSEADLGSAKFIRGGKTIGVDLLKVLKDRNDANNLVLNSGDMLEIPRKKETITINGQVYNPTSVPFREGLKLKKYLDYAGGVTDSAFVKRTYVRYGNGRMDRTKSFLFIKSYPKIENGSEIFVPARKKYKWTPAERIAVSSAMVSIATILVTVLRTL
ncbi:Soluble ligand binding domain-containing protein [Emticicia oligotrophica DSM 17448]|uniref:Soluble ligand binding domain-containing protein n=1 Tax=Emticicia oligotrophica (strain DSM 17448 / CIP 109782 / MTCC 6937 / GPTSA100-15) TaxID=929562 RepID=A0ABM5N0L2_EMTOG|nr:SLBB domain-containing protein [Emticicia oligotrophica]AFK02923.1 Soluble ligand binding domain-containing protein [Emticicia oligotrophica DSM 17448]